MGDINLKLDADQYALVAGVLKADDAVKNLIKSTTKLGTAGARSGKKLNDGFKGFLKTAGAIAGGLSLDRGIRLIGAQITAELAHLKQQQARAGATQMTFGQTRNAMLLNVAAPGKDATKIDRIVSDLSKGKYQAKRTDIMAAMGGPLSGRGALSLDQMKGSVKLALLLEGLAGQAAPMGLTAGAIMDVRKLDPRITDKQALGFQMGVGQASRVTEYEKYLSALPPVLASGKAKGFSLKDSATMFAYMTQMGGDTEGTISATGTINFQKALDLSTAAGQGLLPYTAADRTGKLGTKWRTTKQGGMAALKEIQDAWPNMTPDQRKLLQIKMGGKAKTQGPIGLLLGRDPAAMAAWNTAAAGIPDPTSAAASKPVDDYLAVAGGGEYEMVRRMKKVGDRAGEEIRLKNKNAMSAVVRDTFKVIQDDYTGSTAFGNKMRSLKLDMMNNFGRTDQAGALKSAIDAAQGLRDSAGLGRPKVSYRAAGVYGTAMIDVDNPDYNPGADTALGDMIGVLREMLQEMKNSRKNPRKVELDGSPGARAFGE